MKTTANNLRRFFEIIAILGLHFCSSRHDEKEPLIQELGFSEFAVTSEDDAYVHFYVGSEVLEEVSRTGTFVPANNKSYCFFNVPKRIVDMAAPDEAVTLSLCDPNHDISFGFNNYHPEGAMPPGQDAPGFTGTQGMYIYPDRVYVEHHTGDPGVFGIIRVGFWSNGYLSAGVSADLCLPSNDCYVNSGILCGSGGEDQIYEDPLIPVCYDVEGHCHFN